MLIYTKPEKAALSLSNVYNYMGWEWPLAVGRPPTPEEVLKQLVGTESYLARKPWLWMVLAGRLMVCYASDNRKLAKGIVEELRGGGGGAAVRGFTLSGSAATL